MRVTWTRIPEVPEEYWGDDYIPPVVRFIGEVIGTVNTFFGGTKLVVMTDEGRVVEVSASEVSKA